KTASLLGSCAAIGGIVSGATERQVNLLRDFGRKAGMAFQIRDDYVNFKGLQYEKPKDTGTDALYSRPNIVTALETEFDSDTAVKMAKELNARYVEDAVRVSLELGEKAEILAEYAELMRIP
ncbi:MAG: polyprenyl synthetase family protein, partial [Thermoprotei archaeon]